jgi:hypothetical protein
VLREGQSVAQAVGLGDIFAEALVDSPPVLAPGGDSAARR